MLHPLNAIRGLRDRLLYLNAFGLDGGDALGGAGEFDGQATVLVL